MIALITPTGARAFQFRLCAKYMQRQTYDGPVLWIIVDDAEPQTTDFISGVNLKPDWRVVQIRPTPFWQPGQNTQGRNIAAGVRALLTNTNCGDIEAVFIIEDDDYYKPEYLSEMMARLPGFDVIGETHTIYYNLALRRWIENKNAKWSSLFQTAFTMDALPRFQKLYGEKFIDYVFFQTYRQDRVNLFRAGNLAVGIKGQAGRAGIGAGHGFIAHMLPDPDGEKLRELIGGDYENYYPNFTP